MKSIEMIVKIKMEGASFKAKIMMQWVIKNWSGVAEKLATRGTAS